MSRQVAVSHDGAVSHLGVISGASYSSNRNLSQCNLLLPFYEISLSIADQNENKVE